MKDALLTGLAPTACLAPRCIKSTKLVNFQFRFLHRILPTNLFLTKIDIKQDPNCSFCNNHPENLIHLFWNCTIVAIFWENLTEKLKQVNLMTIDYSKHTAIYLGLRPETSKFSLQLNFCFLLARYYICFCTEGQQEDPDFNNFFRVPKIAVSHRVQQPRCSS